MARSASGSAEETGTFNARKAYHTGKRCKSVILISNKVLCFVCNSKIISLRAGEAGLVEGKRW